jgi:hypothetical protein
MTLIMLVVFGATFALLRQCRVKSPRASVGAG